MNVRFLSILLGLVALQWGGELRAQTVPGKDLNFDEIRKSAVEAHQELARQFADFQKQIQLLKNRLDRSSNIEDRDRANQLQKVLDRAESSFIRAKFARLQELLRKPTFLLDDYKEAAIQNAILAKDLSDLAELFEGHGSRLSDEIKFLEQMIKMLNDLIRQGETLEAITRGKKVDPAENRDMQKALADKTKELANKLAKNPTAKPGDGKPPAGGGLSKPSESTPKAGGNPGDGKPGAGEGKDGGKPGDAKPGDGKGDPKDSKPSDSKPGDKGPDSGNNKKDNDKKDPGATSKGSGDAKGGDSKPSDSKSEGQGGEGKGADEPRLPKDPFDPQNPKSPSFGNPPPPIPGKPFPAPPAPGAPMRPTDDGPVFKLQDPGDMPPRGDQGDMPDAPYIEPLIGKKQVIEAYDRFKDAIPKIPDNIPGANKDQDEGTDALRKARDEMEKRLKMLRLEEAEQILAALRHRCEKMKMMQIDVLNNPTDGTIATEKAILSNSDQKPTDANFQASLRLAAKEKEIIVEIDKCLEILRTDATGVAFPVAFEQVRDDMRNVYRRLDGADVGKLNQSIQQDIIDSLDDMIKALKQKEIDLIPMPPKPPGPPKPPKEKPDPSLLKLIQELKMIRAMQDRLNKRTEKYAKLFPGQEQPSDPLIRREVSELRARQEQIFDITNKLQKKENQ